MKIEKVNIVILHNELLNSYPLLYNEFLDKIKVFLYLEDGEQIIGENMSIRCIEKENYGDEIYITLYWNHFQRKM